MEANFVHDEACDWSENEGERVFCNGSCDNSPTAYVGDIYYACESHFDEMREWVTS